MMGKAFTVTTVTRVHYELDDDLHRRAKAAAGLRGVSLKAFVEQALEAAIQATEASTGARITPRPAKRARRR
jgi:hypothetical protein